MMTKAVRLYGKNDLRLEEFELPTVKEGEILARIVSDSICMSSYKAAVQGADHKRVPENIAEKPIIIGHEFCGELVEVGKKWQHLFKPGDRFAVQPALNDPNDIHAAPGYSFQYIGGAATYIIIPEIVMQRNCLLKYDGDAYFYGSLSEPVSCIVAGFHVNYHTSPESHDHKMGIVEGGNLAILAGVGPMGLGAIDYAIHNDRKPGLIVVTDIDEARIARAASLLPVEEAAKNGVILKYINTKDCKDVPALLRSFTEDNRGYDDIFVLAPVPGLIEQADQILSYDGCLNFFAGPSDQNLSALINFYNVHYNMTHFSSNSGGNTDDIIESLELMADGRIDPSTMVTHIGGLNSVIDTILNLPDIPGGKKLIYTHIDLPLTSLADFRSLGENDPLFAKLADIIENNNGLWNAEAENCLLANARYI